MDDHFQRCQSSSLYWRIRDDESGVSLIFSKQHCTICWFSKHLMLSVPLIISSREWHYYVSRWARCSVSATANESWNWSEGELSGTWIWIRMPKWRCPVDAQLLPRPAPMDKYFFFVLRMLPDGGRKSQTWKIGHSTIHHIGVYFGNLSQPVKSRLTSSESDYQF